MNEPQLYTPAELEKIRDFFAGDLYATETTGIVIDAFTVPFTVIKKNFNMIRTLPSNMENGGMQVKARE